MGDSLGTRGGKPWTRLALKVSTSLHFTAHCLSPQSPDRPTSRVSRVKRCSYPRGPLLPGTCHFSFVGRCPLGAEAEHIPQGIAAHGDTVVQSAQERGKESLPPNLAPASRKGSPFLFFRLLSLTPLPFLLPSIVSLPSLALACSSPSISLFSFFPPVLPQLLCFPLVLPYLSSPVLFHSLAPTQTPP